jgi:hypothetical protein
MSPLSHPWKVTRQLIEKDYALSRWDRAYQCLLQITYDAGQLKLIQTVEIDRLSNSKQEANNENSSVCQSFDPLSNPTSND